MKMRLDIGLSSAFISVISLTLINNGCSTTGIQPDPAPSPPAYTQVPHPVGMDYADLALLFRDPAASQAPKFTPDCDQELNQLNKVTQSKEELLKGSQELVKSDPVQYHWCFYGKLFTLENELKSEAYLEERQKKVLETFAFLVPVAKAFSSEYHDSRYLRWSVTRYQKLSETIFYRKLELTPQGTVELVQPANPFGLWRSSTSKISIIEKYHLNGSSPGSQEASSHKEEGAISSLGGSTPTLNSTSDPEVLPSSLPSVETSVPAPLPIPSPQVTSR